ncbi:MAG: hypothetical protein ACT4OO_01615 [Nitrospiraceae bacterium]
MSKSSSGTLALVPWNGQPVRPPRDEQQILADLHLSALPFSAEDITAGSENELQAVVVGSPHQVDLPLTLEASNYFRNILKRAAAGDSPKRVIAQLEEYLHKNQRQVWENSWVRVPLANLSPYTSRIVSQDLLANKKNSHGSTRSDLPRFLISHRGEDCLRIPVSYLLKLALAQVTSDEQSAPISIQALGRRLLRHFLNDNSSPETFSFYVVPLSPATHMGRAIAVETAKRFLLTQLLTMYANRRFRLSESGQRVMVYFAPHPPIRQKELNNLISDSFYRELFMNPCLSGWDRGEDKHKYMHLCHQVLSRSQLNAVIKLKDAGIITRNLVVLPSTSNISLANNGTHLSLGSRVLTQLQANGSLDYDGMKEKCIGDLVIKIVEHFLPLFVGTYSAAPYRLDFWDFHPEKALGFLPHELDFTHLRMLWRRWKKKAGVSVFGHPMTPVGPLWLDRLTSVFFGLKGDFVPDFRLIDYLVALLSTDQSPALDGAPDNEQRLKADLAQLGVFDESMSLYLLYKLRAFSVMGFSGFEGRHYSLFPSLLEDFSAAANLQALLTGLAFQYIAKGIVRHTDIPDDPSAESERRQLMFAAAIGVQTCNVRTDSPNHFLMKILAKTQKSRPSRRYTGYLRVRLPDYCQALVSTIEEEAPDLIEAFNLRDTLLNLRQRLDDPEQHAASGKVTADILKKTGTRSAMQLSGQEFNLAAEQYYRNTLRVRQLREAVDLLEHDFIEIDAAADTRAQRYRRMAISVIGQRDTAEFLAMAKEGLLDETIDEHSLRQYIHLTLIAIERDMNQAGRRRSVVS